MNGTPPPPNRYPTLAENYLAEATKQAMGFPTLPGLPATVPGNFIMPVLDYDFGPDFNYSDGSGVPTVMPLATRCRSLDRASCGEQRPPVDRALNPP